MNPNICVSDEFKDLFCRMVEADPQKKTWCKGGIEPCMAIEW